MAKKYVIIASCVIDMGGAQMYTRNKVVHMRERGWMVDVISAQKGKVYIPELRQFSLVIPELGFGCYLYSKKIRERIVNLITERILDVEYDEIIIESTCISECTWAEVIAERCKARHLTYLLQEKNTTKSKIEQNFFKFKFHRHELASITDQSIHDMFETFYPITMEQSVDCHLPAYCNNVEEDIDSEWLEKVANMNYDYMVGCLSRLDKPFIVPALTDFINYVETHPDKRFFLMMMGGAPDGSAFEKNICKMFMGVKNVELIITGYLFPVSTRLLSVFDAFFTSAGSSWVCMRSGVPTITYDGNDLKPIGILGRTTNNFLFRDKNELPLDFNTLMDKILITKSFHKNSPKYEFNKPDFSSHDNFLTTMATEKRYYSFGRINLSIPEQKLSYLLRLFGAERYFELGALKRKVFNISTSDR